MPRLAAVMIVAAGLFVCLATPTVAVAQTRGTLGRVLPEMKLTGVTFGDALDFIRDVSGVNLHVNWKALEAENVTADTPVNIHLRSVTLRKVLNLLLSEASGTDALTYYVDQGVVEITTREMADKKVYTKIYPIQDLTMDVPDFQGPNMSLQSASDQAQQGGGGGSGIFGQNGDASRDREKETQTTRDERGQQLADLIMESVRPEIWAANGGTANIRYFNGNLIVTAPRSVHEAIGG